MDLGGQNNDYFPAALTDSFYDRDEKCLLRGTDWVFNYYSG